MATNPLYKTNDSPNNNTQPTKAVNRQSVYVPRTHNSFDMSYFHYKTQRFGQYEPFFVMEGVPKDVIPLHSSHQVRSLPMATPFLAELSLNKDYFMIPNQAIQPNTWEYCYDLPSQGDDVPDDAHNVWDIWTSYPWIRTIFTKWNGFSNVTKIWVLLLCEPILSQGSLLYNLGYKINLGFSVDDEVISFDSLFESFVSGISDFNLHIDTDQGSMDFTNVDIDVYTFISLLRRYGSSCTIDDISFDAAPPTISNVLYLPLNDSNSPISTLRMDRVCAYQLACAQYYVNPQVDFVYNAQLFRDNFFTLLSEFAKGVFNEDLNIAYFSRNGINVPYDFFSKYYYDTISQYLFNMVSGADNVSDHWSAAFDVINYLFGFRESLRFGDYFTDSRTRPLAIGDNNVEVTSNGVDVIDMSRKIIYQRFRNAVIKLGNNFGDYLRGIMGSEPSPDYHIPKFIAHQDFKISGFEVANTTGSTAGLDAEGQGSMVTNLRTADDHYAFEVTCDMPCIIIGISYFSIPRVYTQTKERHFFHRDRFDMFNPMLQYIGDQAVYNDERDMSLDTDSTFGYQSRNNEYKQRYSQASGGFVEFLPAWSFIADSKFGVVQDPTIVKTQSPDFIRAHDYEFNRFFKATPYVSLGKGFHFIVVYNNKCVCSRPMEVNPSTL